ncbi:hypothetical protein OH76DRAFT_688199 [Lentinus brumalis]|uniref:Uncharacterized protein n=1 Tax=Lentinus brumalis TaxID=2498619 RepID=A0A371D619_9APHY|nr:hypothetical protein OH76DRAFT_688199 [Polyporus brumalis]
MATGGFDGGSLQDYSSLALSTFSSTASEESSSCSRPWASKVFFRQNDLQRNACMMGVFPLCQARHSNNIGYVTRMYFERTATLLSPMTMVLDVSALSLCRQNGRHIISGWVPDNWSPVCRRCQESICPFTGSTSAVFRIIMLVAQDDPHFLC